MDQSPSRLRPLTKRADLDPLRRLSYHPPLFAGRDGRKRPSISKCGIRGQSHFRQPRLRRGARENWDSPQFPVCYAEMPLPNVISNKHLRRAITLWAGLALAVSVKTACLGGDHSVFPVFAAGSRHWWADMSLYANYTPTEAHRRLSLLAHLRRGLHAACASARTGGNHRVGSFGIIMLVWGLHVLVRDVLPGEWPPRREAWFLDSDPDRFGRRHLVGPKQRDSAGCGDVRACRHHAEGAGGPPAGCWPCRCSSRSGPWPLCCC